MNFNKKLLHFLIVIGFTFCVLLMLFNCSVNQHLVSKASTEDTINNEKLNLKNKLKNENSLIFKNNYPYSKNTNIIKHNYFTLSYNEEHEQAEWVAYKLNVTSFSEVQRTNDYREDSLVASGSASPYDYRNSGYDRGHLASAESMSINYTAMSESFYMSNISPQEPSFNRGIWKRIENKVRYWTGVSDSLHVVTGPLLNNPIKKIGKNRVSVPNAFYKTILVYKKGKMTGFAFLVPNEKSDQSIYKYLTTINDIENLTNIDFYPNLNRQEENSIENNKSIKSLFLNK
jgi:endonuclease G